MSKPSAVILSPFAVMLSPFAVILSPFAVILSPFAVILSEAKDLLSWLRVNSAKHPCSLSLDVEGKRQLRRSFARPKARRAQDDKRLQIRKSSLS